VCRVGGKTTLDAAGEVGEKKKGKSHIHNTLRVLGKERTAQRVAPRYLGREKKRLGLSVLLAE